MRTVPSIVAFFLAIAVGIPNPPTSDRELSNSWHGSNILAHDSIYDESTKAVFDQLIGQQDAGPFLDDNYASLYFGNLNQNFGNNIYGTCAYVSMGMLLSFYDSYWSDAFIPDAFEVNSDFLTDHQEGADFTLIPTDLDSPGIRFEHGTSFGNKTIPEFYSLVDQYSGEYFQLHLISIAETLFGSAKFNGTVSSLGLTLTEMMSVLLRYLAIERGFASDEVLIEGRLATEIGFSDFLIDSIVSGTPVILRLRNSVNGNSHSVIAYDYDTENEEIYVHTGWRDESTGKSLSHVPLSDLPYDQMLDAVRLILGDGLPHAHAFNYVSTSGEAACACSFVYPRELDHSKQCYGEDIPAFEWKSLYKEKWCSGAGIVFDLTFLDQEGNTVFQFPSIDQKAYFPSLEEWEELRFGTPGNVYRAHVKIDDSCGYVNSDEYWCSKTFTKPVDYDFLPYIGPSQYGYADAYPTDTTTSTQFVAHQANNGFSFRTRRYRTGFIQGEYVVMSPMRKGYDHAFVEYSLDKPVSRLDVELSHWRPYSHERLNSDNGMAELQVFRDGDWVGVLDLLSDSTALPTDRTHPRTYKVVFDQPTTSFRFYSEIDGEATNNDNRGRICIGNLAFYPVDALLPTSGYELPFDTSLWDGDVTEMNNCYSYAINNQVEPGTNQLWFLQSPGVYSGIYHIYLTKPRFTEAVREDFATYNQRYGSKLIFREVGKYTKCPEGTYKIAIVACWNDYHFYRQDADGYWSHKLGSLMPTRLDASGNPITDPETCDTGKYDRFHGFYAVTPWNNLYQENV